MTALFDRFGCFGKLPLSREFLVDGQPALSASDFDGWIAEALGVASMQMGSRYRSLAAQFPSVRFSWAGRETAATEAVGILYPSRDGAGRIHPFTPLAWVSGSETSSDELEHPLLLTPIFKALEQLTDRCRRMTDTAPLLEAVRQERTSWDLSKTGKQTEARDFFVQTSVTEFQKRLNRPGSVSSLDLLQLAQAMVETVTYLRGRSSRDVRLGIRVPISSFGDEASLEVCFWSELIRVLFQGDLRGACLFWSNEEAPAPQLHFFFSTPSAAQWSALIDPESALETVSYLERPYGGPPSERMDPRLKQVLETGSASLADWLRVAEEL